MGECIISRGASGSSSGGSSGNIASNGLVTEIFTSNVLWHVPQNLRNNEVSVRLFGGGGSGSYTGGFGGHMNNAVVDISGETDIFIIIGAGGINGGGGTTSFGSYLSANGGSIVSGNSGGSCGGAFSTGGSPVASYGGGGGGAARQYTNMTIASVGTDSSSGGIYGGGGGSVKELSIGGCINGNTSNRSGYGGNGGLIYNTNNDYTSAKSGTNTIGMGLEFEGAGLAGNRSDRVIAFNNTIKKNICAPGGGGGYGGNGGNGVISIFTNTTKNITTVGIGCGGGGGYGANGGDGYALSGSSSWAVAGGGGGGYGGDGGSASGNSGGGGGGYGKHGKGGGYHNINGVRTLMPAGIAAGGFGSNPNAGGDGVCILQYYLD